MLTEPNISADHAQEMLKNRNNQYLIAAKGFGDISVEKRKETLKNGQHPYAVIVTCSDSRVIPEYIFFEMFIMGIVSFR